MSGQGETSNMTMQHNEGDHGQQQQRQHIPPPHPSPHHSRPSTPMPTNQQELEAYVQITEQRMNEMRAQAHQQLQQLQHTEQRLHQAQQQLQQNQHVQQHAQPIHAVQPVIRMRELKLLNRKSSEAHETEFLLENGLVILKKSSRWVDSLKTIPLLSPMQLITYVMMLKHGTRCMNEASRHGTTSSIL
jgi:hypothetical protein